MRKQTDTDRLTKHRKSIRILAQLMEAKSKYPDNPKLTKLIDEVCANMIKFK